MLEFRQRYEMWIRNRKIVTYSQVWIEWGRADWTSIPTIYNPLHGLRNNQERIKHRERILHIGPVPIVTPLNIFLDLLLDPLFPREPIICSMLTLGRSPTQCFATLANQIVNCSRRETTRLRSADVFPVVASLPPKEKRRPEIRWRFAG